VWHLLSRSHSTCDFCPSSFAERFFTFFSQKDFLSWPWVNHAQRVSSHHGSWSSMIVPFPTVESAYASHLLSRHGIMLGLGTMHFAHIFGLRTLSTRLPCLPWRSSPGVSCSSGGVSPVLAVEPRCLPSHSGTPIAGHCVPINLATAIDLSLVVHTNVKNMDLIA
jgi:hypothetical protein